jgi:hypothetical protein
LYIKDSLLIYRNVEKEIKQIETVLSSLNVGITSSFVQKRVVTVRKQKENKV